MTRKPDWEQRLVDYIDGAVDKPFVYGSHDCLMHGLGAVKAMTGKDFGRGHRSKYKNELGAAKYLRTQGFKSVEAAVDSILPEKPIGFAQRGDLVLCPGDALGVCYGGYALAVGSQGDTEGLVRIPREQWTKAWAV